MADQPSATSATTADGELAIARLREMSSDLRGCAILRADGSTLACTGDPVAWEGAGAELLAAADAAAGEPASQVHVATEDGEVFALRRGELALIAAAQRFALASLIVCDMRAVLRELARDASIASIPEAA